jgi:hypothetical protein
MRQKSSRTQRLQGKHSLAAGTVMAAIVVSTFVLVGWTGISQSAAQEAATGAAYVESVDGRIVAFSRGKPVLLDALDVLSDRTRLDLQVNSEVRLCHLRTHRLLTLRGPLQALITADGVVAENSQAIEAPAATCAEPVVSKYQGGLVSRGVPGRQ